MVPDTWAEIHLQDILLDGIKNGFSPIPTQQETGYWVLNLSALSDDGIKTDGIKPVAPEDKIMKSLLSAGDFLVSRSNTPDKVGRSIRFKGEIARCAYPDLMMRFRVDEKKANASFIEQMLKSASVRAYFKRCAAGSSHTMVKINKGILEKTPLSVPTLVEQEKIAKILTTWDQAITTTEHLIANSQKQKKALMRQLLLGGKRFPNSKEKWQKHKLKKIADIKKGKSLSRKRIEVGIYAVIAGGKTSPYAHSQYTDENVITISASGAYAGYVAYHNYKIWASDCSVAKAKEGSCTKFIYYFLKMIQKNIYFMQSRGVQPHVYPKDLHAIELKVPSLKEQQKIATVLTCTDKEIETLQKKLSFLKQEKQSLMQQLLTGKRRVQIDPSGSYQQQVTCD